MVLKGGVGWCGVGWAVRGRLGSSLGDQKALWPSWRRRSSAGGSRAAAKGRRPQMSDGMAVQPPLAHKHAPKPSQMHPRRQPSGITPLQLQKCVVHYMLPHVGVGCDLGDLDEKSAILVFDD